MKTEQQGLERYRRDTRHYEETRDSLVRDHPDQWVAIFDQTVVAVSRDLDELLDEVERQRIPVGEAFIEFLNTEEEVLILGEG